MLQIVPGNKFETFIQKDDGQGYLQHHEPVMQVQVCQLEDHLESTRTTMETSIREICILFYLSTHSQNMY